MSASNRRGPETPAVLPCPDPAADRHEGALVGHVGGMKRSVVILVLAIAAVALGAFLVIGLVQGDDTDQLEQNQPTVEPSSSTSP
jgi:hypothetical protein